MDTRVKIDYRQARDMGLTHQEILTNMKGYENNLLRAVRISYLSRWKALHAHRAYCAMIIAEIRNLRLLREELEEEYYSTPIAA